MTDMGHVQERSPDYRLLDVFIGRWINRGHTLDESGHPDQDILTSDVYEWMPGGFFVLHTAYGRIGEVDVGGVEIIGYDATSGIYRSYFFDSCGNAALDQLSQREGVWRWQGESRRATATFSDNGKVQTCEHERLGQGERWLPAMHVVLTKVK
jgi:Protein of unknown function (DUF1579)